MADRLAELTEMFFTHPDEGGSYLSAGETHELLELQKAEIDRLREMEAAFQRSPYDISPCHECGEPTVCLPDGMAFCEACAEKENDDG